MNLSAADFSLSDEYVLPQTTSMTIQAKDSLCYFNNYEVKQELSRKAIDSLYQAK